MCPILIQLLIEGRVMDRATSIPDLLDQAIQLCRRQIRPLLSILLVLHAINLAFGRLVQSLLDPTTASVPDWLLPSALGDLPGVLLARQAGGPVSFGLMLLDLLIMQTCCYTFLIPLFAQHMLVTHPRQQLPARRL